MDGMDEMDGMAEMDGVFLPSFSCMLGIPRERGDMRVARTEEGLILREGINNYG